METIEQIDAQLRELAPEVDRFLYREVITRQVDQLLDQRNLILGRLAAGENHGNNTQ